MNSSLQCLSSYELTNYFLNDSFKLHLNKTNSIGTKGILALNYAALIKHLWYGTHSSYRPGMFKDALSNYQKMFLGDTTEFFNYLLDGFHEDLNKVQNKPIIKSNDDINVSNTTLSHNP